MKLDYKKLHTDIIKKLNRLNISLRKAGREKIINRSTVYRIHRNGSISLDSYLRIIDWLEKEPNEYIETTRRPLYIEKRLNNRNP